MRERVKGFIIGVMTTAVFMGAIVFAKGVSKDIKVISNGINLTVNGKKIETDNFLYNGTTYIPLRAAAEALGKKVGWDAKTNTASINN